MDKEYQHIDKLIEDALTIHGNEQVFFVQIGAGAGDRDSRAGFRDGFTEHVKKAPLTSHSQIILVEPNPLNLGMLRECWSNYPNTDFHQIGITRKALTNADLPLFYTELDAPHYQVASFNPSHVLMHYPQLSESDLKLTYVETDNLEAFIAKVTGGRLIILLALDIEGIDSEVILDTDFSALNISLLSFEHLHLGASEGKVINHLTACGFIPAGMGVDHRGHDSLYRKLYIKEVFVITLQKCSEVASL